VAPRITPPWILLLFYFLLSGVPLHANESDEDDRPQGGETLTFSLSRGDFKVRAYPAEGPIKAVVVFGSGDGGWSWLEDTISREFQKNGCEVLGVDFAQYAETDYSEKILGADIATIAEKGMERSGNPGLPLIYSGWSMGSVQMVAAAGWRNHPPQLAGLLLLSADGRGRYGLRESDILGFTPTGPGTFALADFDKRLKNLRVAQINGSSDFMSSSAWIRSLHSPKAFYLITGGNHGFNELDEDFSDLFPRSLSWVLGDDAAAPVPVEQLPWGLSPLWPVSAAILMLSVGFLFSRKHSPAWLCWGVCAMGVINLIESLQIQPPEVIDWIQQWMPLDAHDNSRILLLVGGLCLLLLTPALLHRRKVAWSACVGWLVVSAVVHLARSFDWHHTLAAISLIIPLVLNRRIFCERGHKPSWKFIGTSLAVFLSGFYFYTALALYQINDRSKWSETLTWQGCIRGAVPALFLQRNQLDAMHDDEVSGLLQDVRRASLLAYLTALAGMVYPAIDRKWASRKTKAS